MLNNTVKTQSSGKVLTFFAKASNAIKSFLRIVNIDKNTPTTHFQVNNPIKGGVAPKHNGGKNSSTTQTPNIWGLVENMLSAGNIRKVYNAKREEIIRSYPPTPNEHKMHQMEAQLSALREELSFYAMYFKEEELQEILTPDRPVEVEPTKETGQTVPKREGSRTSNNYHLPQMPKIKLDVADTITRVLIIVSVLGIIISAYNMWGALELLMFPSHQEVATQAHIPLFSTAFLMVMVFEVMKVATVSLEVYFKSKNISVNGLVKIGLSVLRVGLFILSLLFMTAVIGFALVAKQKRDSEISVTKKEEERTKQAQEQYNSKINQIEEARQRGLTKEDDRYESEVNPFRDKLKSTKNSKDESRYQTYIRTADNKHIQEVKDIHKLYDDKKKGLGNRPEVSNAQKPLTNETKNVIILALEQIWLFITNPNDRTFYIGVSYFIAILTAICLELSIYISTYFWTKKLLSK